MLQNKNYFLFFSSFRIFWASYWGLRCIIKELLYHCEEHVENFLRLLCSFCIALYLFKLGHSIEIFEKYALPLDIKVAFDPISGHLGVS